MRGGKLRFLICVWFLFMCGSCLCSFVVEKNSLKVISPEYLRNTYPSVIGNFGVPKYGGTLTGLVVYPNANHFACKNFTDETLSITKKAGSLPFFLLADRGDCYFTDKAWHAQNAGAAAILVANNWPGKLITINVPEDDADFAYITIPALLISHSLGVSIKKALEDNDLVQMEQGWSQDIK